MKLSIFLIVLPTFSGLAESFALPPSKIPPTTPAKIPPTPVKSTPVILSPSAICFRDQFPLREPELISQHHIEFICQFIFDPIFCIRFLGQHFVNFAISISLAAPVSGVPSSSILASGRGTSASDPGSSSTASASSSANLSSAPSPSGSLSSIVSASESIFSSGISSSATVSSSAASPSASLNTISCTFNPGPKRRTSSKFRALFGRDTTTQYHVTCRNSAIRSKMEAKTFVMKTERIWPKEFSWTGPFYITPNEITAQLFGAIFLDCTNEGGVVIIELQFDTTDLIPKDAGTATAAASIGNGIRKFLRIPNELDPVTTKPKLQALPLQEQLAQVEAKEPPSGNTGIPIKDMIFDPKKKDNDAAWQAYKDFKTVDYVTAAAPYPQSQQGRIADAQDPTYLPGKTVSKRVKK
ncbi:hypothetical protein C8R43DRAFT_954361 [Mycena crocata]|nr:hypothetical protein C8R43DRAFT_954361 [Mycena crocata]